MDSVRALASCVLLVIVLGEGNKIKRSSLVGHSVTLECSFVTHSKPANVTWSDEVHTSTKHPIVIFQSVNNPTFMINERHPIKANLEIDRSNFALKISNLSYDSSGDYSCLSESDGRTSKVDYKLTVHGKQYCSGRTQLLEGQNTSLTCGVRYSAELPSMKWHYEGTGVQTNSIDHSLLTDEGPVGEQELQLRATHEIDDKVFTCRMDFGDKIESCQLRFNVSFAVRDVTYSVGQRSIVHVGEEVECSARGNPRPDIALVATVSTKNESDRVVGSRIVIPKSWEGSELTLECTAKNTYKGRAKTAANTATLLVIAATTPTTTTLKPTPKPTEPAKPVVDGENNGAERRLSASLALLFVAMSLTLRAALCRRC